MTVAEQQSIFVDSSLSPLPSSPPLLPRNLIRNRIFLNRISLVQCFCQVTNMKIQSKIQKLKGNRNVLTRMLCVQRIFVWLFTIQQNFHKTIKKFSPLHCLSIYVWLSASMNTQCLITVTTPLLVMCMLVRKRIFLHIIYK